MSTRLCDSVWIITIYVTSWGMCTSFDVDINRKRRKAACNTGAGGRDLILHWQPVEYLLITSLEGAVGGDKVIIK